VILAAVVAGVLAATLAGCGRRGPSDRDPPPFLAFGCGDDQRFLAAFSGPDTARLVTPDGIVTLLRVPTASGARYAGPRDTLWTHGDEAMLMRGALRLSGCLPTGRQQVLADLWRDGAVFTAAGNEPFWSLTAWPDSLVLVEDLGTTVSRLALADAVDWTAPGGWSDPEAGVAVVVSPGPCLDTMSGAPYPWAVTVTWKGRALRGCGLGLGPRF